MNAAYLAARAALAVELHGAGVAPMLPLVVRNQRCPHCSASPGNPCVAVGTGRPLTRTPAHPARYDAAGVEYPAPARTADERTEAA